MFAIFTDRARRAMQAANREATHLGHDFIGAEHILLGILAEDDNLAEICRGLGGTPEAIRRKVEALAAPVSSALFPVAKRVIEGAIEQSQQSKQRAIDTHHLLLAILRMPESTSAVALQRSGINVDHLREELIRRYPPGDYRVEPLSVSVQRFSGHPLVDELRKKLSDLQERQEAAIVAHDFESAAAIRDQKQPLLKQLDELLHELARDELRSWKSTNTVSESRR
jgi:ATP-dependent Clp protease ATP-binding subunit ClpC